MSECLFMSTPFCGVTAPDENVKENRSGPSNMTVATCEGLEVQGLEPDSQSPSELGKLF